MSEVYTFSSLMRWLECPRRYAYEYEALARPAPGAERPGALLVGSAVHAGVAQLHLGAVPEAAVLRAGSVYAAGWPAEMPEAAREAWRDGAAIVTACVEQYPWAGEVHEGKLVEQVFEMPIPGLGEARYAGRLDLLVKANGRWCVNDVKTTGRELAPFVKQQRLSQQYSGYVALARHAGYDAEGVVLDVIEKPRVTKKFGVGRAKYHREPLVLRSQDQFWSWVKWCVAGIREYAKLPLGVWPQNTGACYGFGLCAYYEACRSGTGALDAMARKEARHEELL
jgi:hypothetical protein